MTNRWPSRILGFALWAVAAFSGTFWLLKILGVSEAPVSAAAIATDPPSAQAADVARVLGPAAAPGTAVARRSPALDPASRMRLLGVVANRANAGVALISVEGQPPRPYRVGSQLDGGYTLTRVAIRSATLSPAQEGAAPVTLELTPIGAAAALRPGAPQPRAGLPPGPAPVAAPTLAQATAGAAAAAAVAAAAATAQTTPAPDAGAAAANAEKSTD